MKLAKLLATSYLLATQGIAESALAVPTLAPKTTGSLALAAPTPAASSFSLSVIANWIMSFGKSSEQDDANTLSHLHNSGKKKEALEMLAEGRGVSANNNKDEFHILFMAIRDGDIETTFATLQACEKANVDVSALQTREWTFAKTSFPQSLSVTEYVELDEHDNMLKKLGPNGSNYVQMLIDDQIKIQSGTLDTSEVQKLRDHQKAIVDCTKRMMANFHPVHHAIRNANIKEIKGYVERCKKVGIDINDFLTPQWGHYKNHPGEEIAPMTLKELVNLDEDGRYAQFPGRKEQVLALLASAAPEAQAPRAGTATTMRDTAGKPQVRTIEADAEL